MAVLLVFLLLEVFSDLSQSSDPAGLERWGMVLEQNVVGVLGEEVYLHCRYTGNNTVTDSSWKRILDENLSVKMSGFKYNNMAFSKESFSTPASRTNLTVKVGITSLMMEGRYSCVFNTEEDEIKDTLFLTVTAQPEISTREEDEVNGSQSVSCSALNAKPPALVSWEICGVPPDPDVFSIHTTTFTHANGTSSVVSELRFPVLLNNESRVSCVVQHPALTQPRVTDVKLQRFVLPSVSMELVLKQKDGQDFLQVLCTATEGRPRPILTWIRPNPAQTEPVPALEVGPESVASSLWIPPDLYEGENITCVIGYPLLPAVLTRTIKLPEYHIDALQLRDGRSETSGEKTNDLLKLDEGGGDIVISTEVIGNVPSYKLSCTREGGAMPEEVAVIGSDLVIKGPVNLNLSGQYQCKVSYLRHSASLRLQIEVNPRIIPPVSLPPNVSAYLWKEAVNTYVECLASDAFPAATVSWVLPQDLNVKIQSNTSSYNGSVTVRSVLTLLGCLSREATVQCVVNHPELVDQERRLIHLPTCVSVKVTLQTMTVWVKGMAYSQVNCSANRAPLDSIISWETENCRKGINTSEPSEVLIWSGTLQGDGVGVWSSVRLPVHTFAGCTVFCVLEHQQPERNSVQLLSGGASSAGVKVGPLGDSELWAALCEYRGFGLVPNITWIVSDHDTTTAIPTSIQPVLKGITVWVKSSYTFNLSQHEGKNLTCLIQNPNGIEERRTVNVPQYFISSVVVQNDSIVLRGKVGHHSTVYRVALQEAVPQQIISFRVAGNTPSHNIRCFRSDGSPAHTGSAALVFAEPVSEQDAGLYTCHATWYHHKATVQVQVEVTSLEIRSITFILIIVSSATAITLFLLVTVFLLCKRTGERPTSRKQDRRQRESLSGLMQTPCSPDFRMAAVPVGKPSEYAELVRYSIVIDQKSTV